MAGNSFGHLFRFTTWGESHGPAIGCVVDGVPPRIALTEADIQHLDKRRPGQSKFTTQRQEPDTVKILSGVFEGQTTGTPIGLLIENVDQRSGLRRDQGQVPPRPCRLHLLTKYGIRDYRGGGRHRRAKPPCASRPARSRARCSQYPGRCGQNPRRAGADRPPADRPRQLGLGRVGDNPFFWPDRQAAQTGRLSRRRAQGRHSTGAVIEVVAEGIPAGLGAPVYDKLDADLARR